MDEKTKKILEIPVKFYHELLYKNKSHYEKQWDFLHNWDMEQPDLKRYKVGYCPQTDAFSQYYKKILSTYAPIKEALIKLGIISSSSSGLTDSLKENYFFPCYDERGNLFNVILYHPHKGFRLLITEDRLGVFGLWQESYCLEQHEFVFLLPDIKSFFHFNRLLFPTGFNPCLACMKGINPLLIEHLENLGVGQVIAIAQKVPSNIDTYLEIVEIKDEGTPLKNLKKALPHMANQQFRRLIEVGLEVMKDVEIKRRQACDNYSMMKSVNQT